LDLAERLRSLAYFGTGIPDLGKFCRMDLGENNHLYLHNTAQYAPEHLQFEFGGRGNSILIDEQCFIHGRLRFNGSNNLAVVRGRQGPAIIDVTLYDSGTLVWGERAFAWGVRIWVQGAVVCTIGDDCLFSEGVTIRTSDHHSVVDLALLETTNRPKDVTFGKHVWVGQNSAFLKGVNIGEGSIIAASSLVNGYVPPKEMWGGVPAKCLRRNVSWIRSHPIASTTELEELRIMLGL
jgi:hypothetical protein